MDQSISDYISTIREYINLPRKQYSVMQSNENWNALCSAMDIIQDIDLGIEAYKDYSHPTDVGSRYLLIFGVLQMLYVQQDAISELHKALNLAYTRPIEVSKIRFLRNKSVGHPAKDRDKASHFIVRATMGLENFQLLSVFPNGKEMEFQNVDILELIKEQSRLLSDILQAAIAKLHEEEKMHKEKYSNDKLSACFPPTLSYHIGKMTEATLKFADMPIAEASLKVIVDSVNSFKSKLQERDLLPACESIQYHLNLLSYPLEKLQILFGRKDTDIIDEQTAYIFVSFIGQQLKELEDFAKEIDEDYSSD